MKKSGLLFFTLLTLSVVLYTYFFEIKNRKLQDEQKEQDSLVVKTKPDEITKITLANKSEFTLEKIDGRWRLTSPLNDEADEMQVKTLIDSFIKEKVDLEISEDVLEPKIYGLDQPVAVLTVEGSGRVYKIEVGGEAIQAKTYLRLDSSSNIIVASPAWRFLADKTAKEFRSKQIVRSKNLSNIDIEVPGRPRLSLAQVDGKWTIPSANFKVDIPAVNSFVAQVENLRALDFATEAEKESKLGLSSPAVVLRLLGKDNRDPVLLKFSPPQNKSKDSFVLNSETKIIYKSYGSLAESFAKGPGSFRDREEPFKFNFSDVIGLRIRGPQYNYRFLRKGDSWYLEKPDSTHDVDQTQVLALLTGIQGARVHEYLEQGSIIPKKEIELLDKEGNLLLKLELGQDLQGKSRILARSSLVKELFSIDSTIVATWPDQSFIKEKAETKK